MIHIRELRAEDVDYVAQVSIDVWHTTYTGIISSSHLDKLTLDRRRRLALDVLESQNPGLFMYVAENELGSVIGFARGNIVKNDGGSGVPKGELGAIYILKEYQRKGLGSLLVKRVVERFNEYAVKTMEVLVLADNPACKFYEAIGGTLLTQRTIIIDGTHLVENKYVWENTKVIQKHLSRILSN